MTLSTGTISMNAVNLELGLARTAPISLNQAVVRTLASRPSGAISMNDLRGKSAATDTLHGSLWAQAYNFAGSPIIGFLNANGTSQSGSLNPSVIGGYQVGVLAYGVMIGSMWLQIQGGAVSASTVRMRVLTPGNVLISSYAFNNVVTNSSTEGMQYLWYVAESGPLNPFVDGQTYNIEIA